MRERSRLIECVRLLLNQRQVVQRIEDHVLAFMAGCVPGDRLACAGNHYFMHISFDQYCAVATANRRRGSKRSDLRGHVPTSRSKTEMADHFLNRTST